MIGWGLLSVCFLLFCLYGLAKNRSANKEMPDTDWPVVSVLIALRNEEDNIPSLFAGLNKIDYPTEKLEILLGDDDSADNTKALLEKYAADSPWNVKVIQIKEKDPSCGPKGGVLQVLSEDARGSFLYFTDADVFINPQVIKELVLAEVDLAGGVTVPSGNSWWGNYQKNDWLFNFCLNAVLSGYKKTVAIMGNNFMITTDIFKEVGGFKNSKVKLVEDFSLLLKLKQIGAKTKVVATPGSSNKVKTNDSFKELIHQRIRWSLALRYFPVGFIVLYVFIIILDYSVILDALIQGRANDWRIIYAFLYWVVQYVVFLGFCKMLSFGANILEFLKFKLLNMVLLPWVLIQLILKRTISWKGRRYGY